MSTITFRNALTFGVACAALAACASKAPPQLPPAKKARRHRHA